MTLTDRQLCARIYLYFDYPFSEFQSRWLRDSRRGSLTASARKAYQAIWRSL